MCVMPEVNLEFPCRAPFLKTGSLAEFEVHLLCHIAWSMKFRDIPFSIPNHPTFLPPTPNPRLGWHACVPTVLGFLLRSGESYLGSSCLLSRLSKNWAFPQPFIDMYIRLYTCYADMHVHAWCPCRRGSDSLELNGCEPQCGCWELNLDFLKERHVLLILEPSLQLLHSIVIIPALCWSVRFCKNRYHGRHLMQELVSLSIHANTNAFKQEKTKPVKVEEHEFEQGCLTVTAEVQQLCVQDGSFELT